MPDDTYTHGHHDAVLRSHRWRTIDNSAAYLVPHLSPGVDLLDVGCGPGTITAEFAAAVAPGRVVGIDRAADVVAAAAEATSGADNVEVRVDDVYRLDAPDDSFDVVHAHQVLQHLSDPVAALVEMQRVCRPGGVVAARDADYAGMHWAPGDPLLDRWLEVYRAVAHRNDADPDAGRHLKRWAAAAGATRVEVTASIWCFSDAADRAWWGGLWADRTTSSAFGEQAVAYGISTVDELATIADAWRRWAADDDAVFLVPHGEIVIRC